jgi:hypothetical protein
MPVRLRGPADVVGIDPNQVIRTDPHPGTSDFEPNCFPCVEFDRADFPWLFTPASAGANAKLRPWLCLVVVRKQDGITLTTTPDSPLPVLQIAASILPASELPDLGECWAGRTPESGRRRQRRGSGAQCARGRRTVRSRA